MSLYFYSNGKLLITAEYLVLLGANALAIPSKFGQSLKITEINSSKIIWRSLDVDNTIWFEDKFDIIEIFNRQTSENETKNTLIEILYQAHLMNPKVLTGKGFEVETNLGFPKKWGLGTSSTLINNIAQWFDIDAFELLNNSFGGSGYDIACAKSNTPILYQLIDNQPNFVSVDFNPAFKSNIYFLYLNEKQSSKAAIASFANNQHNTTNEIKRVNSITDKILNTQNQKEFQNLIEEHESIMSFVLEMQTVKEKLFPDFGGSIKSLGAWGGDFVMVVSDFNPKKYFSDKGYDTLLTFDEMIY